MLTDFDLERTYLAFREGWKLVKKYRNVRDGDSFWRNIRRDTYDLEKEYGIPGKEVSKAVMNILDRYSRFDF